MAYDGNAARGASARKGWRASLSKLLRGPGKVKPRLAPERKNLAGSFVTLHQLGAPSWGARDYAALARMGYLRNPIVNRCIRLISEAAASVALTVTENGEAQIDHPLAMLLARPNRNQSGAGLLEEFFGYLQTAGDAYLEAVRIDGAVRQLFALRPDRIRIRAGADGWPQAYEYDVDSRKRVFPAEDADGFSPILHLKLFHPLSDHYGASPLEAAADSLEIHNAAAAWNKALLDNAARPSGALVYKGAEGAPNLTSEQFERLKQELADIYQGAENAGRPLLLEGGLDWRQISLSPADMDFVEAKNVAAREIALAFGVPPMLLGIPGDNTYANYREANLAFWKHTVIPLLRKTTAAFSGWLGPQFEGAGVEFNADRIEALAVEREFRWRRIANASFLTTNEKRRLLGFPPLEDEDHLPSE
ncbi:MAG: phage portal protein [Parvularculaceae bacterium]